MVVPRNPHPANRRVTPAVVTPVAGAATREGGGGGRWWRDDDGHWREHQRWYGSDRDAGWARFQEEDWNPDWDYEPQEEWVSNGDEIIDVSDDVTDDDWSDTRKSWIDTPRAG